MAAAAAAPVKVHGPPVSTAVSRVLTCLIEKDVHFQVVPVSIPKGEHKTPQFLKIQPFGQVPAFEDEDITLFESRAICRYICNKYPNQGNKNLFGTNPLIKASIDQWMEAEAQSFNQPSLVIMFQHYNSTKLNMEKDEKLVELNEEKLNKVLDVYDKRLGEYKYLAGDEFTLADLFHLPNAQYLVHETDRCELITSRKNVARWWDDVSGRESWKKVVGMHHLYTT